MLLREIYDRKIDRNINPAVVVSDKRKKPLKLKSMSTSSQTS